MTLVVPPDLTVAQTAIWLDQQLFAGRPIYNTGQFLTIPGELRVDLFEQALRETVAESPGLRLSPRTGALTFELLRKDFRHETDPRVAAEAWMRCEMRVPFALDDPALFRFALLRIGDSSTLWFHKYHHLIIDATGRRLLSARVAARYRALRFGEPLAAVEACTPQQVIDAEQNYAASREHDIDRDYWIKSFAEALDPLIDINRQDTERGKSGVHSRIGFTISRADFTRLETAARDAGSSTFRAIVALVYAAFARLYNRNEIALGIELAHRSDARARQMIGLMARPLPMRVAIDPTTAISGAMHRIDELQARSYPHRRFPIQELVRELDIVRKGQHGLFDVIVNYIPAPYEFAFEQAPVELTTLSNGFPAPWLVTITDPGLSRDLDVALDTDPGLIPSDVAQRLASSIGELLRHGLDDPDCPLSALPVMPQAARAEVLALAPGATVALPDHETLATLCAAQAERTPQATALICGDEQLSFAALHDRAARLARRLSALGVKPGVVVGVSLPRTPDLVVAVLAVHKAGGAYLALDPAYPAERIRFYVSDTAARVIVTNAELAPAFAGNGAQLVIDGEEESSDAAAELVPARPDDLAYVLYTSGSTGQPKAVGIEHRNLVNLVSWGRSIVSDAEIRGFVFSTSLNFDLSAFEMFVPLAFGGTIILVDNVLALQSSPHRDNVRLINTGPSLFEALLRAGALPPAVTTVILAGEKLPRRLADTLHAAAPNVRLLNCYGPTETTVYSTVAMIDFVERTEPTIGRAIWNTALYVLDSGRALVPHGAVGELYIGGDGVARGYLERRELTAERFVDNPFGPGRIYRTGDLVRWRRDGDLDLLGRADHQLKINGIRVEPGEIEAALAALPGITAAAVAARDDTGGTRRLAAYLVGKREEHGSADNIRAALERTLPRNMVPAFFIWLDKMPLTPNGKLDRNALPAPERSEPLPVASRGPETEIERELAATWEDLLRVSPIGMEADFYDAGGDSLALLSLFASIEARYGRRLTVDVLSGGLTIASLARLLAQGSPAPQTIDPVVKIQPHGRLAPFFCVHGVAGDIVHLHLLSRHMGRERPFFGIRRAPDARYADTLSQMAARYVAAMLEHQPSGPFYLGGHSFGATLAFEIALQLEEHGHEIGLLAIIDQRRPAWRLSGRDIIAALPRILARLPGRLRDELALFPPDQRPRHLVRTLQRWTKVAFGREIEASSVFDIGKADTNVKLLFESNLRAIRQYRPRRRLRAPLTLVRSKLQLLSSLALDRTLGWRDFTDGGVAVHEVQGNHHTMMGEPLVRDLAHVLREEIARAEAGRRSGLKAAAE